MLYPLTEHWNSYHSSVISLKEPGPKPHNGQKEKFKLTIDTVNEHLRKMEYAVRGTLPMMAAQIEKEIKNVSYGDVVAAVRIYCCEMIYFS